MHLGLRTKLLVGVIGTVAALLMVLGVLAARHYERLFFDEMRRQAGQTVRSIALSAAVPLMNHRVDLLDNALDGLTPQVRDSLQLRSLAILDHHNVVVADLDPRAFGRDRGTDPLMLRSLASDWIVAEVRAAPGGEELLLACPVGMANARWGTVLASFSLEQVRHRVSATVRTAVSIASASALVAIIVLYVLLTRLVIQPVLGLKAATERLGRGEGARPVPLHGNDEIQTLAAAFNGMAATIAAYTHRLEEMVAERTRQLAAVNVSLKQAVNKLDRLARTDGLTGLLNHRAFHEALAAEFARATRYGKQFALCMIDVDHFKHYNDRNGHPAGDEVLRALAGIFGAAVRTTDIAARYGGEEFTLILVESGREQALRVAARILELVHANPFPQGAQQPLGRVTVSIGVALWPAQGATAGDIVGAADRALYVAKREGRDRFVLAEGA